MESSRLELQFETRGRRQGWAGASLVFLSLLAPESTRLGVAAAQTVTGNLFSEVRDAAGAPLPGVMVTAFGLGAPRTRLTDARGEARFLGLDPGAYRLEATLEGFATTAHDHVVVGVGRNTAVALELVPAVRETLTVTSESPLLDERRLHQGVEVSRVELEKIPTARDPWAILVQAPGVLVDRINVGGNASGQQANFRAPGVTVAENVFALDGVELTDMSATGTSHTYFDFDQFAEIDLTTGGTDVTKSTAGVSVNLVTKRGTNQPRGSARFYSTKANGYFGGALKQSQPNVDIRDLGDNREARGTLQCLAGNPDPACTHLYVGPRIREIEDVGFEAGGPLMRDRAWLWGSWGQSDIQQNAASGTADDTILENQSLKLNAQLTSANSVVASFNNGDKLKFGRGASTTRPDITTWNQRGPSAVYRLEDAHVVSPRLFLSGTYSVGDFGFQLATKGGTGRDAPEAWQRSDGVWQQNFQSGAVVAPNDELEVDSSYFAQLGGTSHELKIGGRLRAYESFSAFTWPGRNFYTRHTNTASFVVAKRGVSTPTALEYGSVWAQDTIAFRRLTLNLGLRYDHQVGRNEAFTVPANPLVPHVLPALEYGGSSHQLVWTSLLPRLGVTYALGEDRSTLLRASFARFASQLAVSTVSRTNPAGEAHATFRIPHQSGPYTGTGAELDDPGRVDDASGFDPGDPAALVDPDVTDPGLDPELTSELVLELEHALRPELVLGLAITARDTEDVLESRDLVRDESGAVRTIRREDFVLDSLVAWVFPEDERSGGPARAYVRELYVQRPGLRFTGGSYLLNGSRERHYLGIALTAAKRLADRWALRGFVHYGKGKWRLDEEFLRHDNPNRGAGDRDGDLYFTDADGSGRGPRFLQASWSANVTGVVQVAPERPWGFDLAAAIQAREGYPLPYADSLPLSNGQLRSVGAVDDFDDYRLDDVFVVDLRLEKQMSLTPALALGFGIDVFNVTNAGTELSRETDLASSRAFFLNDSLGPRIYRLGVRLAWQ